MLFFQLNFIRLIFRLSYQKRCHLMQRYVRPLKGWRSEQLHLVPICLTFVYLLAVEVFFGGQARRVAYIQCVCVASSCWWRCRCCATSRMHRVTWTSDSIRAPSWCSPVSDSRRSRPRTCRKHRTSTTLWALYNAVYFTVLS